MRKTKGQALVETALVIFIAVTVALAAVNGLWVLHAVAAVGDAAEVGAQTAALHGGATPEVGQAIQSSLDGDWIRVPISYTVSPEQARLGDLIQVRVQATEPMRFIFWPLQLHAQAIRSSEKDWGW